MKKHEVIALLVATLLGNGERDEDSIKYAFEAADRIYTESIRRYGTFYV